MSQSPQVGKTLRNRYRIVKLLESGGFGVTYLADDLDLPGPPKCVVKHLKPKDPNPAILKIANRLFEQEAQILYRLGNDHDQIPRLFAHFEENGEFYLVQEFVDGHDLTKELTPGKQLSEAEVIDLLQNILEVLTVVHKDKVIHRDIKPGNLMRRKDGKIVLIDFGAVKEIEARRVDAQGQTTITVCTGTPGYMPSEQLNGKPKLCSDVYAVGKIGIQALTGLKPNTLKKDPSGEVIWREHAQVSDSLADVIDKMVRYNFNKRYQSADVVLKVLRKIISPLPPQVPSTWELLRQAAITGSCGWLLAMLLSSFIGTVWIRAAFWLVISGVLIFGVFNKNRSVVKKLQLFVIAAIASGATYFVSPQNFHNLVLMKAWSQILLFVVLLAILSGLFAFILLVISQRLNVNF